ncbi:MAG: DUF1778 domain-containing protein [Actinobacteria bacterium]|jgi:uncharacterized protein (DUF1778 family)|nr:DUF1778 domain-containing protein [Actinomycetota bacterium]
MPSKTERLEICVDAATKARIEDAAARLGQSASVFVIDAATAEADRVLARAEATVMPAEQFDTLLAALDMPDEAAALARLAQRDRRYLRSGRS